MFRSRKHLINILIIFITILSFLLAPSKAQAAGNVIYVNTERDEINLEDGKCSLREAIFAANQNKAFGGCKEGSGDGVDTILIPNGTYILKIKGIDEDNNAQGDFDILESVRIQAQDSKTKPIIVGEGIDRLFHIHPSVSVSISNLKITRGSATGGAILNQGNLNISGVVFFDNTSGDAGGAILNEQGASLAVSNSTFDFNRASKGGAIFNKGTLTINQSLFVRNSAPQGGAIYNNLGSASLVNVSILTNIAKEGAGIYSTASVTILNSTIVRNTDGVGIQLQTTASGWMKNSIISEHGSNSNCLIIGGARNNFKSQGFNLFDKVGSGDDCVVHANDITGKNPELSPKVIASWGTESPLPLLSASSPAIDAGSNDGCPIRDQQGDFRMTDGNNDNIFQCDIGAFEYPGPLSPDISFTYLPVLSR
mgnify:CR=1 FL=1